MRARYVKLYSVLALVFHAGLTLPGSENDAEFLKTVERLELEGEYLEAALFEVMAHAEVVS